MKKFLTTSEAAEICGVAHTTVIRWISEGKLKAHETPGGHRRIERRTLVVFLKHFDMPVPPAIDGEKYRILAVDDDKSILSMLGRVFSSRREEIELKATLDGMEALVMLGQSRFDMLILDVAMPGMDGIKVCQTIKKNPALADLKIIIMTGRQLSEEQEEYLRKNSEAFIRKPIRPSVLLEKVEELMGVK